MKVLISAIACNPYSGSEPYFGWSAVKALARQHELWVLTTRSGEADLLKAKTEGLVPDNVHFVFAGQPKECHPNRMIARLQSWRDYIAFSQASLPVARQLHTTEKFDLVHHVTYATWRVASPLWQLGIPFVFGPIGGYEQFPLRLFPILSPMASVFELARMASNLKSRLSPAVRNSLQRAAHVFVANVETEQLVKGIRGSEKGISRLMSNFHSEARIAGFSSFGIDKNLDGPLRIFAGGNMEGRKGVALALAALAVAKKNGVKFHYRLGANGPEIAHLKRLANRLGLKDDILFTDGLRGEAYQQELGATHIYLLPSLRDSAPVTLTEAMIAGCVPIVACGGGPEIIVTDECGYKILITNRKQMVSRLAEVIIEIDRNREIIKKRGGVAAKWIASGFSEVNYLKTVNTVYQSVVGSAKLIE